jgi:VanZ family protein
MLLKYHKWSLLCALVILILCGMPGKDVPHISFLEALSFDKFVHAGIFFTLILFTIRGFLVQPNSLKLKQFAKIIALTLCVIYGGLLEIMQGTLCEGRNADVFDFIADSVGCITGLSVYNWVEKHLLIRLISAHK